MRRDRVRAACQIENRDLRCSRCHLHGSEKRCSVIKGNGARRGRSECGLYGCRESYVLPVRRRICVRSNRYAGRGRIHRLRNCRRSAAIHVAVADIAGCNGMCSHTEARHGQNRRVPTQWTCSQRGRAVHKRYGSCGRSPKRRLHRCRQEHSLTERRWILARGNRRRCICPPYILRELRGSGRLKIRISAITCADRMRSHRETRRRELRATVGQCCHS